jgi:type VI protein secretion system component VasF
VTARPPPDRVLAWADAHRRKLLAVVILLYALGFNGQWRMEPDSALYLTIGRNLAEGRGYTYHGAHHHLAYPGPPLASSPPRLRSSDVTRSCPRT